MTNKVATKGKNKKTKKRTPSKTTASSDSHTAARNTAPLEESNNITSIAKVARLARRRVSVEDLNKLKQANINKLVDISTLGGADYLKTLELGMTESTAQYLSIQSDFQRFSQDSSTNHKLIRRGIKNVFDITDQTLNTFVKTVGNEIDKDKASQIYKSAQAYCYLLNEKITEIRSEVANGNIDLKRSLEMDETELIGEEILAKKLAENDPGTGCQCKNCESAVSPSAYLIDLLKYAEQHINGIDNYDDWLHQPITELPVICDAVETKVRTMCIGVEILRSVIKSQWGELSEDQQNKVIALNKNYAWLAYKSLLNQMGTSYEEVREFKTWDEQKQSRLYSKLKLPNGAFNELSDLHLDPDAGIDDPSSITELRLEELFGFIDTTRNPLSDGPVRVSNRFLGGTIKRWNITYEWNRSTSKDGKIYVKLIDRPQNTPRFKMEFYRDKEKTEDQFITHAVLSNSAPPTYTIVENEHGLDGTIQTQSASSLIQGTATLSPMAEFFASRIIYSRMQWLQEDYMKDEYSNLAFLSINEGNFKGSRVNTSKTIVDPDLITINDIRNPYPGDKVFDLWEKRRNWIDDQITRIEKGLRPDNVDLMFQAMFESVEYHNVSYNPWPQGLKPKFTEWMDQLQTGENIEVVNEEIYEHILLNAQEFLRLSDIRSVALASTLDSENEPPSDEEWYELICILIQSIKRVFEGLWIQEEQEQEVSLNHNYFKTNEREPESGYWPPKGKNPLIDPQLIRLDQLRHSPLSWRSKSLWLKRETELAQELDDIKSIRQDATVDVFYAQLLQKPIDVIVQLYETLNSTDPDKVEEAQEAIKNLLKILVEDFVYIMDIRARSDSDQEIPEKEWHKVESIFLKRKKHTNLYSGWRQEEKHQNTGISYFQVIPAKLPPWRATIEQRSKWKTALANSATVPLIDPDQIDLSFIRDPLTSEAGVIWDNRFEILNNKSYSMEQNISGLHEIIVKELFNVDELKGLKIHLLKLLKSVKANSLLEMLLEEKYEEINTTYNQLTSNNQDIVKNATDLVQIGWLLPVDKFKNIFQLSKIVNENPTHQSKTEWAMAMATAYLSRNIIRTGAILLERATGRLEHIHDNVALSELKYLAEKHFVLANDGSLLHSDVNDIYAILTQVFKRTAYTEWKQKEGLKGIFLSPDYFQINNDYGAQSDDALRWRQDSSIFRRWRKKLSSRIEQQQEWTENYFNSVDQVEAEVLPYLRDGLREVLTEDANALSTRYQYDFHSSACSTTTRTSSAITTMQNTIEHVSSGYWQDHDVTFDAPHFDDEWKWLGGYETWRAAMFSLIYPENLLNPSIREDVTPGLKRFISLIRHNGKTNSIIETAISAYEEYYKDVWSLSVSHSCTVLINEDGNQDSQVEETFLFARGGASGKLYWSSYRGDRVSSPKQSYWEEMLNVDELQLIDCVIAQYSGTDDQTVKVILLLFRDFKEPTSIKFLQFDVDKRMLINEEPDSVDIELPEEYASPILGELKLISARSSLPKLMVHPDSARSFITSFNDNLTGLESQWEKLNYDEPYNGHNYKRRIADSFRIGDSFLFVVFNLREVAGRNTKHNTCAVFRLQQTADEGLSEWILDGSEIGLIEEDENYVRTAMSIGTDPELSFLVLSDKGPGANLKATFITLTETFGGRYVINEDSIITKELILPQYSGVDNFRRGWSKTTEINVHYTKSWQVRDENTYSSNLSTLKLDNTNPLRPESNIILSFPRHYKYYMLDEFSNNYGNVTYEKNRQRDMLEIITNLDDENQGDFLAYHRESCFDIRLIIAKVFLDNGLYEASFKWYKTIIDYTKSGISGSIFYEFGGIPADISFLRPGSWLKDPTNPHVTARKRRFSYLRYTLISIVRCILAYADSEFAKDTVESVKRATKLYRDAIKILNIPHMPQPTDACDNLEQSIKNRLVAIAGNRYVSSVNRIASRSHSNIHSLLERSSKIDIIEKNQGTRSNKQSFATFLNSATTIGNQKATTIRETNDNDSHTVRRIAPSIPQDDLDLNHEYVSANRRLPGYLSTPSLSLCILPNPLPSALRIQAEINLYKIRTCRNIAGLERVLDPYAAPIDPTSGLPGMQDKATKPSISNTFIPTGYRYIALIERAKQLVQIAQQMEASFLSSLEKYDTASYELLKARHDQQLAKAGVKLQDLRVNEANEQVKLAELQFEKAEFQSETYSKWYNERESTWELELLKAYDDIESNRRWASAIGIGLSTQSTAYSAARSIPNPWAAAAAAAAITLQGLAQTYFADEAIKAERRANIAQFRTAYYQRKKEWWLNSKLASHDSRIASRQKHVARKHVNVVEQERSIAEMQTDFATEVVEFLGNKFTNADLYEWMSDVLENVYRYFLQQATSTAKLAQDQMSFERQQIPVNIIRGDYWEYQNEQSLQPESEKQDRRGITGSARLLKDIYQLDQFAFETDKRKSQLTKIISLANMAPAEFQRFRETGTIQFYTTLEQFDRDFPGDYLRLIKQVRTSVIALIPPTEGIKANLSCTGLSRVVVGERTFQTIQVQRPPESVSLSSPVNATGVFELQPNTGQLLPFEGIGVDTSWEFTLPKTTNQFDFRTIADVLISVDYTALNSSIYRDQVLKELDYSRDGDLPISIRQNNTDGWYQLHNPTDAQEEISIDVEVSERFFPPNISNIKLEQILLYASSTDKSLFDDISVTLTFREKGKSENTGGSAYFNDGLISTAQGDAKEWNQIRNRENATLIGTWTIVFPNNDKFRELTNNEKLNDILLVLTYSGELSKWPE